MENPNQSPPPAAAMEHPPPPASASGLAEGTTAQLARDSAAAAEATPPSPRAACLSLEELDWFINHGNWTGLNDYMKNFMNDVDHPEVFIHCHRGKLIDLLRAKNVPEATNFFFKVIVPLGQTSTPYAKPDHIKSPIDDMENSLSTNRPVDQPTNLGNLIKDYCRLNFPEQVGHENQGYSKLWSFALKLERKDKKVKFRCLLCGDEDWCANITESVQLRLQIQCPKVTESVIQRLADAVAARDASKVNRKKKCKRQAHMVVENRIDMDEWDDDIFQPGEQLNAKDCDEFQNIKDNLAEAKGKLFDLMITHNIGGDNPTCKKIKECLDSIYHSAEEMTRLAKVQEAYTSNVVSQNIFGDDFPSLEFLNQPHAEATETAPQSQRTHATLQPPHATEVTTQAGYYFLSNVETGNQVAQAEASATEDGRTTTEATGYTRFWL